MEILKGFGRLFYIIDPRTSYQTIEHIPKPDFIQQAIPYFVTFILIEYCIQWIKNKPRTRLNDGITSISHGIWMICENLLKIGPSYVVYIHIYENWRLFELDWSSPITWYIAAIGGDLGYYWAHRAGHEINLFWALHQVHHSSEDYNLTTALRQSAFQSWFSWLFYLPMALFLPPSQFIIHQQFNLLYQFWIHTEVVDNIGPLEYILNTPKHHRIHHGCNRYCLDKNYAGVLIIWDRMFGTFQSELPGEITYGLVEDVNSFNSGWLQIFYLGKIWNKAKSLEYWKDKASAALKGPGWFPGLPRLGDSTAVAEWPNRKKYDPKIPAWQNVYVLLHFTLMVILLQQFTQHELSLNQLNVIIFVAVMLFTLTSIGFLLDGKRIGIFTEIVRCAVGLLFITNIRSSSIEPTNFSNNSILTVLLIFFSISLLAFLGFSLSEILNIPFSKNANFSKKLQKKKYQLNGTKKAKKL